MVDAVNKNGGNAKLTIYKNCGHDAWSQTYANRDVFDWLLSHKRTSNMEFGHKINDIQIYG